MKRNAIRKDEQKVKVLKCHISVYQYTWTSLNLRAEKSLVSEVLTVIPSHTKFEVIGSDHLWLKVIYDGQIGYVFKQTASVSEVINSSQAAFLKQRAIQLKNLILTGKVF